MNKMNEVAKLLGVELEQCFSVDGYEGKEFYLSRYGLFELKDSKGYERPDILQYLLGGRCKFRKLPWEPNTGEHYYVPSIGIGIQSTICKCGVNTQFDKAMYDQGFMCKTPAEADNLSKMFIDVAKKYRKMTNNEEEILDIEDEDIQLNRVKLYFKNLGANSSNDINWAFYNLVEAYLEDLKWYRRKYGEPE